MPKYQVRVKYSEIRTFEVEAPSKRAATVQGINNAKAYYSRLLGAYFGRHKNAFGDSLRLLSIFRIGKSEKET